MIRRYLRDIEMDESKWYEEAIKSGAGWKAAYRLGCENIANRTATEHPVVVACKVVCDVYYKSSGRKPVCEQHGTTQCPICRRLF